MMLKELNHTVPKDILDKAMAEFSYSDFKTPINEPTGNFFYSPWTIRPEFRDTIWESILQTLPYPIGEARLINLKYGVCYQSHADIDDRYHLNIQGDISALINLETNTMYPVTTDGKWYEMDASSRHSAANFGYVERIQLVVRKLLNKNNVSNPTMVVIKSKTDNEFSNRFLFDNHLSGLLNIYNKNNIITDFNPTSKEVKLCINSDYISELESKMSENFYILRNNND